VSQVKVVTAVFNRPLRDCASRIPGRRLKPHVKSRFGFHPSASALFKRLHSSRCI